MSSEFAEGPRMSLALEFQRGDIPAFREPLLDPAALQLFATRIRPISKQISQYTHMYQWSFDLLALATFLQSAPLR